MEQKRDNNTEQRIVEAAKKVFVKEGMLGARMQQIADEANINKALLHYYFRSKEKLFQVVFEDAVKDFLPRIMQVFGSEAHLFDKIYQFVEEYLTMVKQNPYLPMFILHEMSTRPEKLADFMSKMDRGTPLIKKSVQEAVEEGIIRPIEPVHLFVNIVSLCAFPIIAKPMIMGIFMEGNNASYEKFLQERKNQVADFIINSIKIEKKQDEGEVRNTGK